MTGSSRADRPSRQTDRADGDLEDRIRRRVDIPTVPAGFNAAPDDVHASWTSAPAEDLRQLIELGMTGN